MLPPSQAIPTSTSPRGICSVCRWGFLSDFIGLLPRTSLAELERLHRLRHLSQFPLGLSTEIETDQILPDHGHKFRYVLARGSNNVDAHELVAIQSDFMDRHQHLRTFAGRQELGVIGGIVERTHPLMRPNVDAR